MGLAFDASGFGAGAMMQHPGNGFLPMQAQPFVGMPCAQDVQEPVALVEEDRLEWMRKFLVALDEWKTLLDDVLVVEPPKESDRGSAGEHFDATPASEGDAGSQQQDLAVFAATA